MLRREEAKTTALVLTAVIMVIRLVIIPVCFADGLQAVALSQDCSIFARLLYPFFHASFLHALLNCWVLLCIVFYYNIGIGSLLLSYLVAVTVPAVFSPSQTVGLSAVVFCLLGVTSWKVRRKLYFHCWIAGFIAVGWILPYLCSICGLKTAAPNNLLHIYCYVVGLLVGFLNSPAPWQRRK